MTNHLMYADDIMVFSPSAVGLEDLLRVCELFGIEHDILFNYKKCAVMVFNSHSFRHVCFGHFCLHGQKMENVEKYKYLGHIIYHDLGDRSDICRQVKQTYVQGNILARQFYMCTENVKVKLFTTYCTSMYTAQLWTNHTMADIYSMHVAYNNTFRLLFGLSRRCSASEMFVVRHVNSCQSTIRKLLYTFACRLDASSNGIIRGILSSDLWYHSRIRRHWRKCIFSPSFE